MSDPKAYADCAFVMVDLGVNAVVGLPVELARKLADQLVEAACVAEQNEQLLKVSSADCLKTQREVMRLREVVQDIRRVLECVPELEDELIASHLENRLLGLGELSLKENLRQARGELDVALRELGAQKERNNQ